VKYPLFLSHYISSRKEEIFSKKFEKFSEKFEIFSKNSRISNFIEIRLEHRVVPYRRTDGQTVMTKLHLALRNFVNAPKNSGPFFLGPATSYFEECV
jgi:uncharacterized protein (DUF4415 family)